LGVANEIVGGDQVSPSSSARFIVGPDDTILVTGATGFIGPALVQSLLNFGFANLRVFARASSDISRLEAIAGHQGGGARLEVIRGNLLSREDCIEATKNVALIFHLATSSAKSFPDAFMNSVVTTRNLLEASQSASPSLRRFVNISSFAVYSNARESRRKPLDESSPVEERPERRGDAYCFAKIKHDQLVTEYGEKLGIPYVIVRPGSVFGPEKEDITGRIGISTFGVFLHLGGSNPIPFTYIDNCAEAIVLAGVTKGVEGEVFNVVDDDLPSSREFLRRYKRHVRRFPSIYIPPVVSYLLCLAWEKYAHWSRGQLPPVFNRKRWNAEWRRTRYSNEKLKLRLGWTPRVPMTEALRRYFDGCRPESHA
jgi:nucleoside-diphosphate-sugar epimerase